MIENGQTLRDFVSTAMGRENKRAREAAERMAEERKLKRTAAAA